MKRILAVALDAERAAPRETPAGLEELREAAKDVLAILERVVTDSESQHPGGWGPDVTTVEDLRDCQWVLRAALATRGNAGGLDRTAEVAAALAEVGLPSDDSVAGLIRHHRNNEAAAQGGWKLAYDALLARESAGAGLVRGLQVAADALAILADEANWQKSDAVAVSALSIARYAKWEVDAALAAARRPAAEGSEE